MFDQSRKVDDVSAETTMSTRNTARSPAVCTSSPSGTTRAKRRGASARDAAPSASLAVFSS